MAAAKSEVCQKDVYYLFITILLTSFQSINVRNDKIDVKHLEIWIEITMVSSLLLNTRLMPLILCYCVVMYAGKLFLL